MLTAKQEKFVQNLVKGMSQREAYKNSFNASKMKGNTIDVKASLLFKQDKIRVRYDELIEKTAKKTIISVQERKELLTKIAIGQEYETYSSSDGELYTTPPKIEARMKALDILNKMDGQYIQEIKSNNNTTINMSQEDKALLNNISKRLK